MDAADVGIARDVDVLAALRGATQDLHHDLDHRLPLARPDAGLADYRSHLAASGAWMRALLPWLERAGEGAAAARRLEWIAHDLADCAVGAPPAVPPAAGPARVRAADDGSLAFCFGVLYVVEGAALGGQVLHRRLAERLAPHPLRYLAGAGAATGERWRSVVQTLHRHLDTARSRAAACGGAVAAFEDFGSLIGPQGRAA